MKKINAKKRNTRKVIRRREMQRTIIQGRTIQIRRLPRRRIRRRIIQRRKYKEAAYTGFGKANLSFITWVRFRGKGNCFTELLFSKQFLISHSRGLGKKNCLAILSHFESFRSKKHQKSFPARFARRVSNVRKCQEMAGL